MIEVRLKRVEPLERFEPKEFMPGIKIDHAKCTECRMCYVVCREINFNAVVVSPTARHLLEIDERCIYPKCTVCLMYCPAKGSIVETVTGRSLVPPPRSLAGKSTLAPRTLNVEA
jgi:MinD superfamily P-loop ATPase